MLTLVIVLGTLLVLLFALGFAGDGVEKLEATQRLREDNAELRDVLRVKDKALRRCQVQINSLKCQLNNQEYLRSSQDEARAAELELEVQRLQRELRVKDALLESIEAASPRISPHQSPAVTASP